MHILNRYIRSQVIWSTAAVMFVLIGIQSFMEFVNQLSSIGTGHYGVLQAFIFVPLQLPTDLYTLFPMAGFLGSLIGLGHLASSSQLIVMRAAGVSVTQIVWSVIKAALIMIVVVTVIGEGIAPKLQREADVLKTVAMEKGGSLKTLHGVWLRHGNSYVYINAVPSPTSIQGITRFDFDDQDHLLSVSRAEKGELVNKQWKLFKISESILGNNSVSTKYINSEPLGILFKPKFFQKVADDVDQESVLTLLKNIVYRKKTGLVTSQYEYAFWRRMMQPLTTVVMICLGIPFIFGSLRSSSMGFRIMTGVIIGFGFYMLNQFFGPITLVYQFPPWVAAVFPTVLFMLAYGILIKRVT